MPGWAQHQSCLGLNKHLTQHETQIFVHQKYKPWGEDAILLYPRVFLDKYQDRTKIVLNISSFGTYDQLTANSAFCTNRQIYEKVIATAGTNFNIIQHIPQSVDTDRFTVSPRPQDLVIGWVGNDTRKGKNFELVQELSKQFTVKLAVSSDPTPPEEMQKFYDSISILLCCSNSEGGPAPAFEAGACGVPTLSACRQSAIDEAIVDGYDGYKCDLTIEALTMKLYELSYKLDEVEVAGLRMRRTTELRHSFNSNAKHIERLLVDAAVHE